MFANSSFTMLLFFFVPFRHSLSLSHLAEAQNLRQTKLQHSEEADEQSGREEEEKEQQQQQLPEQRGKTRNRRRMRCTPLYVLWIKFSTGWRLSCQSCQLKT